MLPNELSPTPIICDISIIFEDVTSISQTLSAREPSSEQTDKTQEAILTEEYGLENFRTNFFICHTQRPVLSTKPIICDISSMIEDETSISQTFSARKPSSGQSDKIQEAIQQIFRQCLFLEMEN